MRAVLVCILLLLQGDPFAVLRDPARRGKEGERKAAFDQFSARAKSSAPCWAAARFLERSDRDWRLVYDVLTIPGGAFPGRVVGSDFYTFSGQRFPLSKGKLESNVADPAAAELDAVFSKFYADGTFTPEEHKGALEALVGAIGKVQAKTEALEILRLFAMAHVSGLGEAAAPYAPPLGLRRSGDRWGTAEQAAHYAVARNFSRPSAIDPAAEATVRASASFELRYVALLVDIHRTLERGTGYEYMFLDIGRFSTGGGPKGAAGHIRALATGFKKAIYCTACKLGKVSCSQCQGKRRVDMQCSGCGGAGRIRPAGATATSDATQRCNACMGRGTLRGVPCPGCGGKGEQPCGDCGGRPWRDRKCTVRGCRGGRVPCTACKGQQMVTVKCASCDGAGRHRAAGATIDSDATYKCRDCEGRGTIQQAQPCRECTDPAVGIGFVRCSGCGAGAKGSSIEASGLYGTEPCGACGGAGWPVAHIAEACDRCFGLGVLVLPSADPGKRLQ